LLQSLDPSDRVKTLEKQEKNKGLSSKITTELKSVIKSSDRRKKLFVKIDMMKVNPEFQDEFLNNVLTSHRKPIVHQPSPLFPQKPQQLRCINDEIFVKRESFDQMNSLTSRTIYAPRTKDKQTQSSPKNYSLLSQALKRKISLRQLLGKALKE